MLDLSALVLGLGLGLRHATDAVHGWVSKVTAVSSVILVLFLGVEWLRAWY